MASFKRKYLALTSVLWAIALFIPIAKADVITYSWRCSPPNTLPLRPSHGISVSLLDGKVFQGSSLAVYGVDAGMDRLFYFSAADGRTVLTQDGRRHVSM